MKLDYNAKLVVIFLLLSVVAFSTAYYIETNKGEVHVSMESNN